jgi:heterodisulfide reductase subunit A-like polyferredoxin
VSQKGGCSCPPSLNSPLARVAAESKLNGALSGAMQMSTVAWDVVIAGGGQAGVAAAPCAAGAGAKTLLLERRSCVGGAQTAAYATVALWDAIIRQMTR